MLIIFIVATPVVSDTFSWEYLVFANSNHQEPPIYIQHLKYYIPFFDRIFTHKIEIRTLDISPNKMFVLYEMLGLFLVPLHRYDGSPFQERLQVHESKRE